LVWFFSGFALVAVASLNHSGMGLVIEPHWLFVPSIGFFLFVSLSIHRLSASLPSVLWAFFVIGLAIYLGLATQRYNATTRDEKTYCAYWLSVSPGNSIAALRLGEIAYDEKDMRTALAYHLFAARRFAKARTRARIHHNTGVIYEELGNADKAREHYLMSLQLQPDYAPPYLALADEHLRSGDPASAVALWRRVLAFENDNALAQERLKQLHALP